MVAARPWGFAQGLWLLTVALEMMMKIMKPSDIENLRGNAQPQTHLARYDAANSAPPRAAVRFVLDIECPEEECGADVGEQCRDWVRRGRN